MVIVRKSNEILRVQDTQVNHYLDIGYDVIDERGAVLLKAVPQDNTQLKAEFAKLSQQVVELKATISNLKTQLADAQMALQQATQVQAKTKTTKRAKKADAEVEE